MGLTYVACQSSLNEDQTRDLSSYASNWEPTVLVERLLMVHKSRKALVDMEHILKIYSILDIGL